MITRQWDGFTLIETLMAIILIGTLSVSVLPNLFQTSLFTEKAFFDDVLNAVRYAQKLAVATGCNVQVKITANGYQLKRRGNAASTACPASGNAYALEAVRPGTGGHYSNSEDGVTLTSSVNSFIFYPLGNASADVTLTVNGSRTIQVVGKTGFVYAGS